MQTDVAPRRSRTVRTHLRRDLPVDLVFVNAKHRKLGHSSELEWREEEAEKEREAREGGKGRHRRGANDTSLPHPILHGF